MKNPLDALYAHHEEAEQLFAQSEDIHARNELAQSLTCTRDLIYRLESGEVVMIQEIDEIISFARTKLEAAHKILEPVADTERSPEYCPPC